ncbi:hypothetical protein GBAR_LOCUS24538, partial [Geodia barretti]
PLYHSAPLHYKRPPLTCDYRFDVLLPCVGRDRDGHSYHSILFFFPPVPATLNPILGVPHRFSQLSVPPVAIHFLYLSFGQLSPSFISAESFQTPLEFFHSQRRCLAPPLSYDVFLGEIRGVKKLLQRGHIQSLSVPCEPQPWICQFAGTLSPSSVPWQLYVSPTAEEHPDSWPVLPGVADCSVEPLSLPPRRRCYTRDAIRRRLLGLRVFGNISARFRCRWGLIGTRCLDPQPCSW